jgi:phosphatidylinositol-3-phosphatase
MLVRLFKCRNCGSLSGHVSSARTFEGNVYPAAAGIERSCRSNSYSTVTAMLPEQRDLIRQLQIPIHARYALRNRLENRCLHFVLVLFCLLGVVSCGGVSSNPQTPVTPTQPTFAHVLLVVLENHSYSEVIGNSAMPYLNGLAQQNGLAAHYYANTHPSLPNYFMLTAGQTETTVDTHTGTMNDDNAVRELVKAGKSWKCYAESLPSPGYTGGDVYPYARQHNPFSYISDVQNDASQAASLVPFTEFGSDLDNGALPQYSFIVPNLLDDAHDGTLAQADSWLQQNIGPLIASSAFQASGLLIITFDEGDQSDTSNGGGRVATVIVSTKAKKNYVSQAVFQHQSVLRLMLAASGLKTFPGEAATAPDMKEFFTGQ